MILPKSVTPTRISANIRGALAAYKALTKEDVETLDKVAPEGKQKRQVSLTPHICITLMSYSQ